MMAKKEKKPIHKVQMTEGKRQIIQQLLQEYDIETAEDIQAALKDLLVGGKMILPPHGKEFFHSTVSSFLHPAVSTFLHVR